MLKLCFGFEVKAIMTKYKSQYGVTNKKDGVEFYFEITEARQKNDIK